MGKKILYLVVICLFLCSFNIKEINKNIKYENNEDTICKVSKKQIEKRFFYDSVIICLSPTKNELDSFKKDNNYIQNEYKKYINAIDFLKSKVKNYLIYDSIEEYRFIIGQDAGLFSKAEYIKRYNTPWLIILFKGNKNPVISAPESIEEAFNDYFIKENNIKEKNNTIEDTLICKVPIKEINKRCFLDTAIIFVCPTEKELDSLHKAIGNKYYESLEQDAGMYITDAQTFLLNKPNVINYFINDSVKLYNFVTEKGFYEINKDKYVKEMVSPWLIILFNGRDAPLVTFPASIEEDYNNYFK